jgi:iron complex outermembrane receptor protein
VSVPCPGGQCSSLEGGNPKLKPEISDSISFGFTTTPGFLRGFTGSIDYWDIKIAGEITNVPQSITLQNCLNGIEVSTFCPNVVRTPGGDLFGTTVAGGGYIVGTDQNIASTDTSGIDFQGDYRLHFEDLGWGPWGSLVFHFVGTYQLANKTTTLPGEPTYDCAGLFGPTCIADDPRWRHTFSLTWDTPWNVLARLQWRYIGSASLDNNSNQPVLYQGFLGVVDPQDATMPAVNYLDLSGAWRVDSHLTVRAGINNILDQDPPLVSQAIAGVGEPNGYPTYDLLGREMFISATAKF